MSDIQAHGLAARKRSFIRWGRMGALSLAPGSACESPDRAHLPARQWRALLFLHGWSTRHEIGSSP